MAGIWAMTRTMVSSEQKTPKSSHNTIVCDKRAEKPIAKAHTPPTAPNQTDNKRLVRTANETGLDRVGGGSRV